MDYLTPRLFHPCQQDDHGTCETTLATYRCSCRCHLAAQEQESCKREHASDYMHTSSHKNSASYCLSAVFERLTVRIVDLPEVLNWKHLLRGDSGTTRALSIVNRFN